MTSGTRRAGLPKIAIVGRPNVGKSTLFNRLVGRRLALVDDTPGVTRDRREGEARLGGLKFIAIDTAGMQQAEAQSLAGRMLKQTEAAIRDSDLALFLVDARAGLTPDDERFAALLRKVGKPVVLVANKAEGRSAEAGYYEAFELGFGEPVPISAEHDQGMADLAAAIREHIGKAAGEAPGEAAEKPLMIAVVGRPNVGKSTLVNRIVGEDRMLTGPEAGITRDTITVDWKWRGRTFRLADTAGLRRKARVQDKLEKLSVADAIRALRFAEVVILVVDATLPFEKQDLQLADLIEREGRAIVIALDKWDLITSGRAARLKEIRDAADRLLPQIRGVALVPLSGLTGDGVERLMKAVEKADAAWNRRMPTAALNRWLGEAVDRHTPPAVGGRRLRLRYITQVKARPPAFVLFCSRPSDLPDAYRRYLANSLREIFDLPGTPIRLTLRKGDNPYEGKGGKKPRSRR
jgi:GTP-binding protein